MTGSRAFTYNHELECGKLEIIGTLDPDDEFATDDDSGSGFLKRVELSYVRADDEVKFYGMYTHNELCRMCFSFCSREIISLTMAKMPTVREIYKHMLEITFSAHASDMPETLSPIMARSRESKTLSSPSGASTVSLRVIRENDPIAEKKLDHVHSEPIESKQADVIHNALLTMPPPITVDLYTLGERLARIEEHISILAKVELLRLGEHDQPRLETKIVSGLLEIVRSSKSQMQQLCARDKIYTLLEEPKFLSAALTLGLSASDFEPQDSKDCILSRLIKSHVVSDDNELPEVRRQWDNRDHIQALINMCIDVNHAHCHVSYVDLPNDASRINDNECEVCGEIMDYGNLTLHTTPFKVIMRKIKEASFEDQAMLDSLFDIKQMLLAAKAF